MNTPVPLPTIEATLTELASLGMRGARVVTRMMEIEQQAADIVASWLPEPGCTPASVTEATTAGQALDMLNAAMVDTVPRTKILARALDLVSRMVRRDVALLRRIEAGWTGTRSDNRSAMVRRQVARGVGDVIRRERRGEAAARLFDDLAERLEDPGLETELAAMPVDDIIRKICRELGLAVQAIEAALPVRPAPEPPDHDTG